jgi:hypothetical protein
MKADPSRWPRLKLDTHPVLDWVEPFYDRAWLLTVAEAVRKNPHPIQTKLATGGWGVWDNGIERLLRTLADNEAALRALNHRRPTPPARVVGLNRAVHFHVVLELLPESRSRVKQAWGKVAAVWGVSDRHIKDDVASFRVGDGDPSLRDADGVYNARFFVDQIVGLARHKIGMERGETEWNRKIPRADALKLVGEDMCDRAAQLRNEKLVRRKK